MAMRIDPTLKKDRQICEEALRAVWQMRVDDAPDVLGLFSHAGPRLHSEPAFMEWVAHRGVPLRFVKRKRTPELVDLYLRGDE